jgi:hypothetical protein
MEGRIDVGWRSGESMKGKGLTGLMREIKSLH